MICPLECSSGGRINWGFRRNICLLAEQKSVRRQTDHMASRRQKESSIKKLNVVIGVGKSNDLPTEGIGPGLTNEGIGEISDIDRQTQEGGTRHLFVT